MKNAILLHGTGDFPSSYWFPYVQKGLEDKGYDVWVPELPEADTPNIRVQLPFVLEHGRFDRETVMVSHSAGGPLLLSVLENINEQIRQAILVAGYCAPLEKVPNDQIRQATYDWGKIRQHVKDIFFINSDNDPWGCDDKQGRAMFDRLGGTQIIRQGEGHFGSGTFNQPYDEFPLLLKLIED
jgi:uncharacterized protein